MNKVDEGKVLIIVPGGLNTDIIGHDVEKLLDTGELSYGGELKIGPGGKSRNVAQMAARFLGRARVAMIGITVKDPLGLYKIPLDALEKEGVDISFVRIEEFDHINPVYPGVALIVVDKDGKNRIYVLPGINESLSADDIDGAGQLFEPMPGKVLVLSLEIPKEAAKRAIETAYENKIKVILDPGGITKPEDVEGLIDKKIFLLKPNEHEAKIITGVSIDGINSAKKAGKILFEIGVKNVLITHGRRGAYLINETTAEHIPIPEIKIDGSLDETGCGDQVTAVISALLSEGFDLKTAAPLAIKAGTLQYHRVGIKPVSRDEV